MAAPASPKPFEPPQVPVVPATPSEDALKTAQSLPKPPPPTADALEIHDKAMGTLNLPTATATVATAYTPPLADGRVQIAGPHRKTEADYEKEAEEYRNRPEVQARYQEREYQVAAETYNVCFPNEQGDKNATNVIKSIEARLAEVPGATWLEKRALLKEMRENLEKARAAVDEIPQHQPDMKKSFAEKVSRLEARIKELEAGHKKELATSRDPESLLEVTGTVFRKRVAVKSDIDADSREDVEDRENDARDAAYALALDKISTDRFEPPESVARFISSAEQRLKTINPNDPQFLDHLSEIRENLAEAREALKAESNSQETWIKNANAKINHLEAQLTEFPRPIHASHAVVVMPSPTQADERWAQAKTALWTFVALGALAGLTLVLQNSSFSALGQAAISSSTPLHVVSLLTDTSVTWVAIGVGGAAGVILFGRKMYESFGSTALENAIKELKKEQAKGGQPAAQGLSEPLLGGQPSLGNDLDAAIRKMETLHAAIVAWDKRAKELLARAGDSSTPITPEEIAELAVLQEEVNKAKKEYDSSDWVVSTQLGDKYGAYALAVGGKVGAINNAITYLMDVAKMKDRDQSSPPPSSQAREKDEKNEALGLRPL